MIHRVKYVGQGHFLGMLLPECTECIHIILSAVRLYSACRITIDCLMTLTFLMTHNSMLISMAPVAIVFVIITQGSNGQ